MEVKNPLNKLLVKSTNPKFNRFFELWNDPILLRLSTGGTNHDNYQEPLNGHKDLTSGCFLSAKETLYDAGEALMQKCGNGGNAMKASHLPFKCSFWDFGQITKKIANTTCMNG